MALSEGQKANIVRKFRQHFNGATEISRDDFDLFIIDQRLADDPQTDDTSDPAHKGFTLQRGNAKRNIAKWSKLLPNEEQFELTSTRQNPTVWYIVPWEEAAHDTARSLGNSVKSIVKSKSATLKQLRDHAEDRILNGENPETARRVLGVLDQARGYALVFERNVASQAERYNKAFAAIERTAQQMLEMDAEPAIEEPYPELEYLGSDGS